MEVKAVSSVVVKVEATAALHLSVQRLKVEVTAALHLSVQRLRVGAVETVALHRIRRRR